MLHSVDECEAKVMCVLRAPRRVFLFLFCAKDNLLYICMFFYNITGNFMI